MCLNSDGVHHSATYMRRDEHLHADVYNKLRSRRLVYTRGPGPAHLNSRSSRHVGPPSVISTRDAITYVYGPVQHPRYTTDLLTAMKSHLIQPGDIVDIHGNKGK